VFDGVSWPFCYVSSSFSHSLIVVLCPEDMEPASKEAATLVLTEGAVLGGGAFSHVSVVKEESTGRSYAMKRMRKSSVVQCPEHVFCEQVGGCVWGGVVRLRWVAACSTKLRRPVEGKKRQCGELLDIFQAYGALNDYHDQVDVMSRTA